jgi:hypothetical protein
MTRPERELEVLVDLVRRSAHVEADASPGGEVRRLERAWRQRRQRRVVGASAGLLAAAGAAAIFVLSRGAPAPLGYGVEGDVVWADRHVEVRGAAGARLSFSDGSRFSLSHRTRAELAGLDERGARVRLADGRAHVSVVHLPGARWSVEAGPFTVRVVGTVFDVTWSGAEKVLEVALVEGEVKVDGPLPQLPLAVRAGQRLLVRAGEGTLQIAPLAPRPQAAALAPGAATPARAAALAPGAATPARAAALTPAAATPARVAAAPARALAPGADPAVASAASAGSAPALAAVVRARPFRPGRTLAAAPAPLPALAPSGSEPALDPAPTREQPILSSPEIPGGAETASRALPPRAPAPVGTALELPAPPAVSRPLAPPSARVEPPPAPPPPLPVGPPPPPAAVAWAARVAAGEFQTVLDEARSEGIASSYERRSSVELADLADAARYLGHEDVARGALLALRRRFPGSEGARRAAFRLGVLAEERGARGLDEAIRWYDEYAAEDPEGTYVAEALGRKMLSIEKRDGVIAARPLAESYRRRFPRGPYLVHALRISPPR